MKINKSLFITTSLRLFTSMALAVSLMSSPITLLAADKDAHEDRTEFRVKELHAKLKITPSQEDQWSKVAAAMLEDAKTMDALTQTRIEHAKDMTAIDDLKSYSEIAEAHANGTKKLIPVFEALYASMSDAQKKEADFLFREGKHMPGHKKQGHKKPVKK